ncbi:hypothetical protein SAMN05216456_1906 [Devosia crocina]|uniref:Uncharacterized protein n=2 Tax=Devosia crocina TaxID=429728 RepID=A0A1I7NES5_9HYPH|nr:hypothetical protein SAMN05216456_1906 [Devosia crocina]
MSGTGILALVAVVLVIALPLATFYKPFAAGILGVLAMTAAAVFFTVSGKSAMTETTAAVFVVGAFLLAGLLAVARILIEVRDAIEARDES